MSKENKKSLLEIVYRLCGEKPEDRIPSYSYETLNIPDRDYPGLILNLLIQAIDRSYDAEPVLKAYLKIDGVWTCCNPREGKQVPVTPNDANKIGIYYDDFCFYIENLKKKHLVLREDPDFTNHPPDPIWELWRKNLFSWEPANSAASSTEPERAEGGAGEDAKNKETNRRGRKPQTKDYSAIQKKYHDLLEALQKIKAEIVEFEKNGGILEHFNHREPASKFPIVKKYIPFEDGEATSVYKKAIEALQKKTPSGYAMELLATHHNVCTRTLQRWFYKKPTGKS